MTNQQAADVLLRVWQEHRDLPPAERIERLMADFFSPLMPCSVEYEATLGQVREAMA